MIKVNFFYPNADGSTFDLDYYTKIHVPLAERCFGDALKGLTIDSGITSLMPNSNPPFHAIGTLYFDSVRSFYDAVTPHIDTLRNDAGKYYDGDALIQISEITFENQKF
jgi:uncharacterized protein (TIGR02118 family)